jgi:hypothetical protein
VCVEEILMSCDFAGSRLSFADRIEVMLVAKLHSQTALYAV